MALTPSELKARARERISSRSTANYSEFYNKQVEKVVLKKKEDENFFRGAGATALDVLGNIGTGFAKGIEGIFDFGAGIIGAVGGIFSEDFRDNVQDLIKFDVIDNWFGNDLQEALSDSYLKENGIIEGIGQGLGQMLPAVALSFIPGAGPAVALGYTGTSAAGNATEEAYEDGADYYKGMGYGAASGAVEMATEKIFGGATSKIFGKGVADGLGKNIAKTGVARVAKNAAEEGFEEVVAEVANPALKSIYKGKDAFSEYADGEYWKGVGKSGVIGAGTAVVYGGTVGRLAHTSGRDADISDSLQEIQTLERKRNNLYANNNLTTEGKKNYSASVLANYKNIENALKSTDETKRQKLIKRHNLDALFEADGSLKSSISDRLNKGLNLSAETDNRYISPSALDKIDTVNSQLSSITEDLKSKSKNPDSVEDVRLFNGEMSNTGNKNFTKTKQALNALNKISKHNVELVVVEDNKAFNGSIIDDTLYIGADAFEKGTWAGTLVHEYTHFAEGSKEYFEMVNFLQSEDVLADNNAKKIPLWQLAQNAVLRKDYGFSAEQLNSIKNKIENNVELTQDEQKVYNDFATELVAHETEYLLGNEAFINKIVSTNSSLARKIVDKIINLKKAFEKTDDTATKAERKRLQKAEKLYLEAARNAGDARLVKYILGHSPELEKEVDSSDEIQYNKKDDLIGKTFPSYGESFSEANEISTRWAKQETIKEGWQKLVSFQDNWYLVEKILDSDSGYQIVDKIRKGEYERYANSIKTFEGESYESSIDEGIRLYENGRAEQSIDSDQTENRRADSDVSQMAQKRSSGESSGIETRRNNEQGSRNKQDINYSLKDSQGNSLTTEQSEYFKDSKVRDKYGNLLVVYHGSPNKFTEFSYRFMNTNGNAHGRGFYFTEDFEYADNYKKDGGQLLKGYLDIKKPASETEVTIRKTELIKLIKATCEAQAQEYIDEESHENMDDALLDTWVSNYANTYDAYSMDSVYRQVADSIFNSCGNDVDIFAELTNAGAGTSKVLSLARKVIGYDGVIFDNGNGTHQFIIFESNQFKNLNNINPTKKSDIRFSLKEKITINMSDSERYEILKDKVIENVPIAQELTNKQLENIQEISSFEDLNKYFGSEKRILIKKIASEFSVFKEYHNEDIQLEFEFSKSNFEESYNKQKHNFVSYAKMFSVFDKVVENAIGIEVHNRNIENYKNDRTLKRVYVLVSAFIDGENIIPVKLEVKEFSDKKNTLYIALALESIKKDGVSEQEVANGVAQQYPRPSTISIRDLLKNVNPNDKSFYKYIPKQFFEDIRYSLKAKPVVDNLSQGETRKLLATYTKKKVYSKTESEIVINNIVDELLAFDDKYGTLKGKNRDEIVDTLWKALNALDAGRRTGTALDIADYIIQNAVVEDLFEDASIEEDAYFVSEVKHYLHKLDLSSLRDEIKHKYDKDNHIYLLWGKQSGDENAVAPDELSSILAQRGIFLQSDLGADALFEIDEKYRAAVENLKKKTKKSISEILDEKQLKELRQEIAKKVLTAYETQGKDSKLTKLVNDYREKVKELRGKIKEVREREKQINRVLYQSQRMKDIKYEVFLNASVFKRDLLKKTVEKLADIKNRGNLNSSTRNIVKDLQQWYSKENPMLCYVDEKRPGAFNAEIAYMLEYIATGTETQLSLTELRMLEQVIKYFNHFAETFNKVWRNGKYVEAQPIAEDYVSIMKSNKEIKSFAVEKLLQSKYIQSFADPMAVARAMDKYHENGFYTEMMTRLREATAASSVLEMNLRAELDAFLSENKKYLKSIKKDTVDYNGKTLSKAQAIALYMTLSRDQALLGLAASGFVYRDIKTGENETIEGFAPNADSNTPLSVLRFLAKAVQADLLNSFTEIDLKYISIIEKTFNEDCKNIKKATDEKRNGYSNIIDSYYFPLKRYSLATDIDSANFFEEVNRASSASFNKETVKGAKNQLFIEDVDSVYDRHVKGISQYANLALAIDEYNILFNLNVGENPNVPTSIATLSVNTWREGKEYFKNLLADIQGIPSERGPGNKILGKLRSGYAKSVLGLNPKVWFTQFSSLFASSSILDSTSIVKGVAIRNSDVDEYSQLAKLRNYDNTAIKAQGLFEKVGEIGNVFMKPISKVDRLVVKMLFGACQVQIQKNYGLKIESKENKIKAGELLDKVITETQQNSLITERSAAMRSSSELSKTLTMFTSDAMKVVGRVIDSVGETASLKARLKVAKTEAEKVEINKKLKTAGVKVRKSLAALLSSALFMALIAKAFRWFYNKDDEETVWAFVVDFFGNMLGGLPIIKDIHAKICEGYDVDSYAFSTINNLLDSADAIFKIDWSDSQSIASSLRNILYSFSQFAGIPTKNLYKVSRGLIGIVSDETAYKLDNIFYNKNYRADLRKAIENEDMDRIAMLTSLIINENMDDMASESVRVEINRLVAGGQDVLPRSVGDSITYDGEEMQLTARQKTRFKAIYSQANKEISDLIRSKHYLNASDEIKAKAIKFIYDMYYNLALEDLLGEELVTKNLLFAKAINIDKLAIIVTSSRNLKADTDAKGNVISGSKKSKVYAYVSGLRMTAAEKYMIMGYLGYKNTKGDAQVRSYIQSLKMTKKQKELLYEYSGYSA